MTPWLRLHRISSFFAQSWLLMATELVYSSVSSLISMMCMLACFNSCKAATLSYFFSAYSRANPQNLKEPFASLVYMVA